MKELFSALVKAQSEMADAKKSATNPFLKKPYSDLNDIREAVLPILNQNGIAVLQPTINIEGKNYVKTLLIHNSGQQIESLTEIVHAKQSDPQSFGGGLTYARRYGLQSMVCIGAADDDGVTAGEKTKLTLKEITDTLQTIETLDGLTKFHNTLDAPTKAITDLFTERKLQIQQSNPA